MHVQLSRLCSALNLLCTWLKPSDQMASWTLDPMQHTLARTHELLMLCCLPAGTGKTLLAKAVAGEAGVPFFYRAGSEFEVCSLEG